VPAFSPSRRIVVLMAATNTPAPSSQLHPP